MAATSDIWSDDDPVHGQSATRCCDARYVKLELIYLFDQRLPLVRGWAFKRLPFVGSRWIVTILNSYLTMSQCYLHCHWSDMSFLDKLLLSAFTCSSNTFTEFPAAWMPSLPCQAPLQLYKSPSSSTSSVCFHFPSSPALAQLASILKSNIKPSSVSFNYQQPTARFVTIQRTTRHCSRITQSACSSPLAIKQTHRKPKRRTTPSSST